MENQELNTYPELAQNLIDNKITMVKMNQFELLLRHSELLSSIEGDIVECGVWRGGTSIFLSHLFTEKNIWCFDSYEGFQPLTDTTYQFNGWERHTPQFTSTPEGPIGISMEEVKQHFGNYGLVDEDRIKFVKGFVNETLPNNNIDKISILRCDVDSYSATLDILDHLYNKVQVGGFIIFDDACLIESMEAIKEFIKSKNLPYELHHPITDEMYSLNTKITDNDSGFPDGSYIIKK